MTWKLDALLFFQPTGLIKTIQSRLQLAKTVGKATSVTFFFVVPDGYVDEQIRVGLNWTMPFPIFTISRHPNKYSPHVTLLDWLIWGPNDCSLFVTLRGRVQSPARRVRTWIDSMLVAVGEQ